jgi:hypothetical protein
MLGTTVCAIVNSCPPSSFLTRANLQLGFSNPKTGPRTKKVISPSRGSPRPDDALNV